MFSSAGGFHRTLILLLDGQMNIPNNLTSLWMHHVESYIHGPYVSHSNRKCLHSRVEPHTYTWKPKTRAGRALLLATTGVAHPCAHLKLTDFFSKEKLIAYMQCVLFHFSTERLELWGQHENNVVEGVRNEGWKTYRYKLVCLLLM